MTKIRRKYGINFTQGDTYEEDWAAAQDRVSQCLAPKCGQITKGGGHPPGSDMDLLAALQVVAQHKHTPTRMKQTIRKLQQTSLNERRKS